MLQGIKLNISLFFTLQCYFKVPKTIRLNATHYFIMKKPNKRKLHQVASSYLSGIEFRAFRKFYKFYAKESISFLLNNTTLPSDNSLKFRKNIL